MGLNYRKRVRVLPGVDLNLSKTGASVSEKVGSVTVNSRGRDTVNLGHGVRYQTSATSGTKAPRAGISKTMRLVFDFACLTFGVGALIITGIVQGWW